MKTIKVVLILLLVAHGLSAQTFEMGTDFNFSQPVGTMSRNMNNAFGLSLEAAKSFKTPFSAGMELSFGNYGFQTTRQEYTFDDGSVTETNVNVSNNIFNLYLTGKHFLRNNKKVNPYLSAKAGWSWFTTKLAIEDPEDEYSCHPIESDILSRDNTYSFSGGAGVRIDFQTLFTKMESQHFYFDLSVHSTHGGIVKYMNVKKNTSQPVPHQDVMVKFINTQTQVIHEHHVGYVYTSVLNMVEYRLGVICRPGFK
ncbi:MAG: hypothetical protein WD824_14525 [Cyclobacteriaceae bacterium]